MRDRLRVAILGATGHVGKALSAELAPRHALTLYARRPDVARAFVAALPAVGPIEVRELSDLERHDHDALVNCIGVGDPAGASDPSAFDAVTQYADDLALSYLEGHPAARLVNMSSGAAYCSDFALPATGDELGSPGACVGDSGDTYGRAKRESERRHRTLADAAVIDLRLFGFFSRYLDLGATYLMADVVRSLMSGEPVLTEPEDLVRDYVAPCDLAMLVSRCLTASRRNAAFDVYSASPVGKFELLDAFVGRFGLTYSVLETRDSGWATTRRPAYYSLSRRAQEVGYLPTRTSLDVLLEETAKLMKMIG